MNDPRIDYDGSELPDPPQEEDNWQQLLRDDPDYELWVEASFGLHQPEQGAEYER